jgi:hypothetical protein
MVLYMCAVVFSSFAQYSKFIFILFRLSQLIGSTLALEYMRAGPCLHSLARMSSVLIRGKQNTLRRLGPVHSYLTFYSLAS